jgi:hypothetical protein
VTKYAVITSGTPRVGTVWLARSLLMGTSVDARVTRHRAHLNGDEFISQWRNGSRDFYVDIGSGFASLLPVMREFDPKTVLLVRNPYYQLRSIISWEFYNKDKPEPPQGKRSQLVKMWLARIYGSVELGARLFDAVGLEWEPFGLGQISTTEGLKALADFIEMPMKPVFQPASEKYRNRPKDYVDLDDWYTMTCLVMSEFDKLYPRAVEIFERTGELNREDYHLIVEEVKGVRA